jgi:hypothetical protein
VLHLDAVEEAAAEDRNAGAFAKFSVVPNRTIGFVFMSR